MPPSAAAATRSSASLTWRCHGALRPRWREPCYFEHDPEKCAAVFGKDHAQTRKQKRDDDSKKSHPALARDLLLRRCFNFFAPAGFAAESALAFFFGARPDLRVPARRAAASASRAHAASSSGSS